MNILPEPGAKFDIDGLKLLNFGPDAQPLAKKIIIATKSHLDNTLIYRSLSKYYNLELFFLNSSFIGSPSGENVFSTGK